MRQQNVLVTGGAGYVGSHAAKALADAGYTPIVLDNLSTGHEWAVKWGPLICGDIADTLLVRQTLRQYRVAGVLHFAGSAYVGESMRIPQLYFHNNVANTLVLLEAMLDCGVPYVVFSSSCATYGDPLGIPIDESHPQVPVNPYGESKLFIERVLRWYDRPLGLRSVCLRYFNAAGADTGGEIGEDHAPETHLIPLAIEAARSLRPCVEVFGTDYDTPDGTPIRDYIHVSDLADAHVRALRYLLGGGATACLNLGTGQGRSVREVMAAVERVSGLSVPVEERPRRAGDPAALVAQAREAADLLGWRPEVRKFESTIESAWRWHCSHFSRQLRAAGA